MVLVQGRRQAGAEPRASGPVPLSMASTHPLCQVLEALEGIRQGEALHRSSLKHPAPCLIFGESEAVNFASAGNALLRSVCYIWVRFCVTLWKMLDNYMILIIY